MNGEQIYAVWADAMDELQDTVGVVPWTGLHPLEQEGWNEFVHRTQLDCTRLVFKPSEALGQDVTLAHVIAKPLPYVDPEHKELGLATRATEVEKLLYLARMTLEYKPGTYVVPQIKLPVAIMEGIG